MTYQFSITGCIVQATSVVWDFGDGKQETTTGTTAYHTYDAAGTYTAQATVYTNGGTSFIVSNTFTISEGVGALAYVFALALVVLLLLALILPNETVKFWLAVFATGLMIWMISPLWPFGNLLLGELYTGYLLLLSGIVFLVVSFAPTRKADRARGAWFLLGVIAIVLWYFLTTVV